MSEVEFSHLDGPATLALLDEIQPLYLLAFPGNSLEDHTARTTNQATAPGFATVTARRDVHLIGFAYGLPLPPRTRWWHELTPPRPPEWTAETGTRTFALIDLAVHPAERRQGLGKHLVDELLGSRRENRATLATDPNKRHIQEMYERWGWQNVGRVPGSARTTHPEFDLYVTTLDPPSASNSR
ncbi:GNAT family N-acetyltransferase [Actinocorallia sp. API 0066]|uniref:GNAT family N-acetyltransferase n=1 Tax=Actinocorallia sp. API 0066 TaxID=2896846 RepID=UPI001E29B51C|nr:GNAT family N-acetyltransferase [Actinocorallia sp. API 0066]MCD0450384.1 GNAT family N-acetyltransferase [Actinocorallia sp. API 0066]